MFGEVDGVAGWYVLAGVGLVPYGAAGVCIGPWVVGGGSFVWLWSDSSWWAAAMCSELHAWWLSRGGMYVSFCAMTSAHEGVCVLSMLLGAM